MKTARNIINIILICLIIISGSLLVMHTDHAYADTPTGARSTGTTANDGGSISGFLGLPSIGELITQGLAFLANIAISITAWLLSVCGYILDISLRITLHIKDFVDATPVVYVVWKTIRDITGLFFIFFLLYAAIQMIIGESTSSYGSTIKNIVIAGVLINFSFFIVSIGIDASNVVSQAIYNSMIPENAPTTITSSTKTSDLVSNKSGKLNISDIFMNSLKIQKLYDSKGNALGTKINDPVMIIMICVTGIIMMITTGASFIMAAIAFIVRMVILLFILAFSPLLFVGSVIPQINDKLKGEFDVKGILVSQLLFMPVYLLLMYVALSIINSSNLMGATTAIGSFPTGTNWAVPYITMSVNFALIIIMLNLPLVVGLKMGGLATGLIQGGMKKFSAGNVWKNFGSQVGSRTVGRTAYALGESSAFKRLAATSPILGSMASSGLSSVSSAGFGIKKGGYEDRMKAKKKGFEDLHKKIGSLDRSQFSSEAAYIEAKNNAEKRQGQFRENIPWKNGIMGFMIDNRANKQAQMGLSDEADVKKNKEELELNEAAIKNLEKIPADPNSPTFRLLTDEETEKLRSLRKRNTELEASINRGSGSKKKKDTKEALKALAEENKDEEKPKEDNKKNDESGGDKKDK